METSVPGRTPMPVKRSGMLVRKETSLPAAVKVRSLSQYSGLKTEKRAFLLSIFFRLHPKSYFAS